MIRFSNSAVLATVFLTLPMAARAAYPVYQAYQPQNMQAQQVMYQQPTNALPAQQQQVVYQQTAAVNSVAANPTRVTGSLPRVGSNVTNSGRQYYQPADYDRLADSGLYIGLGIGYSTAVTGAMSADYRNEDRAFLFPGAFKDANFQTDTVIPLQLSIGAAINNDVRVDFSYTRVRGIEYADSTMTSTGDGGFTKTNVTGGAITANATMVNVYYNIDSYTGYVAGGSMRPYIGAGVGISLNTIADYIVYDPSIYYEIEDLSTAAAGDITTISDVLAYHSGGTSEQLAYMLEGGITTEMDGGIKLDFFVRYNGYGKVRTSGSVVMTQTEWLSDGAGGEYQAPYDVTQHQTNWYESGSLSTIDVGIRMRLQF